MPNSYKDCLKDTNDENHAENLLIVNSDLDFRLETKDWRLITRLNSFFSILKNHLKGLLNSFTFNTLLAK